MNVVGGVREGAVLVGQYIVITTTIQTTTTPFRTRTRKRFTDEGKETTQAVMVKGAETDEYTDTNKTTDTDMNAQRKRKWRRTQSRRNGNGHGHTDTHTKTKNHG